MSFVGSVSVYGFWVWRLGFLSPKPEVDMSPQRFFCSGASSFFLLRGDTDRLLGFRALEFKAHGLKV